MPSTSDKAVSASRPRRVYVLLYRRTTADPWQEILRDSDAERLWRRSLEMKLSGHFVEREETPDLFDQAAEPAH